MFKQKLLDRGWLKPIDNVMIRPIRVGTRDRQRQKIDSYTPRHLTHITQMWDDGRVDLAICLYFPSPSTQSIQVKAGSRSWQALHRGDNFSWFLELERLAPGTALEWRYRYPNGHWQGLAPIADLERVREISYIPDLSYKWQNDAPQCSHGRVLMETSLEGILAGYKGGIFAPRSREEMFVDSISRRILYTNIPDRLATLGIDELAVPTTSSVADRSSLNPQFNYLTYDVADIDWQLGTWRDFMNLADVLYSKGIAIVPDLVFANQVKAPFPGTLDTVVDPETGNAPFVDVEAVSFEDGGTWMFELEDPKIRASICEKIVTLVQRYRFKTILLTNLDGIVSQYANREINYGEIWLKELVEKLRRLCPGTSILGETFSSQTNPVVQECVDIIPKPYGFAIAEELYKPPSKRDRPLYPNLDRLSCELQWAIKEEQSKNMVYAQLHNEIACLSSCIEYRCDVPWAYGGNPAELAKNQGEALVELELLAAEDLLDYVRRTVRNVEAMTMFSAKLMYGFVPAVDSLFLGASDTPSNWKFHWDDVTCQQLEFWGRWGISDRQIYLLHASHREDMVRLRQLFRNYTVVHPETLESQTEVTIHHLDRENCAIALWRYNWASPYESLLILFNLGPVVFKTQEKPGYELLAPLGFDRCEWEILFDGDWIDPLLRTSDRRPYLDTNQNLVAYTPGTIMPPYEQGRIGLNLGAFSLIVLKPYR